MKGKRMAPLCPFLEPSLSPQVSSSEASIPVSSRRLTSSSEHSVFCHPPARILYYTGRTLSLFSCTMYPYQSTRKYVSRGLGWSWIAESLSRYHHLVCYPSGPAIIGKGLIGQLETQLNSNMCICYAPMFISISKNTSYETQQYSHV